MKIEQHLTFIAANGAKFTITEISGKDANGKPIYSDGDNEWDENGIYLKRPDEPQYNLVKPEIPNGDFDHFRGIVSLGRSLRDIEPFDAEDVAGSYRLILAQRIEIERLRSIIGDIDPHGDIS